MTTTKNNQHPSGPTVVTATEIVMPGHHRTGRAYRSDPGRWPRPQPARRWFPIEASGVSFAEQSMRRGRYPGAPKFPFVPGYDLVGTVTSVGPDVDPALVGQRVAALTKSGGWASHALLTAADLVPVPAGLDPAEAETLVVNGLTAWQMLHRTAQVRPGQTILVHGANGGVGTTLVQLARHHGVRVIGVASPRHHDALRGLGVEPGRLRRPRRSGRPGPRTGARRRRRGVRQHRRRHPARVVEAAGAQGNSRQLRHLVQPERHRLRSSCRSSALLTRLTVWNRAAQRSARVVLQRVDRPPAQPHRVPGPPTRGSRLGASGCSPTAC